MEQGNYKFVAQWFNPFLSQTKEFSFLYGIQSGQIQVYELKTQKIFLKKAKYPHINLNDLFIGNIVQCYKRQFKIVAFGNQFTQTKLSGPDLSHKTLAILKPNAYKHFGKIIEIIEKDFTVGRLMMFKFDQESIDQFYKQHQSKQFYNDLTSYMLSGFSLGVQILAAGAATKWRTYIGPADVQKAKKRFPKSLRAVYGEDIIKNAIHCSSSSVSAQRQINFIFSKQWLSKQNLNYENSTLCIIKPHMLKCKNIGAVIDSILSAGYQIVAMQTRNFDQQTAQKLYDSYKLYPQYKKMIAHLISGHSIAVQLRKQNALGDFKRLCGPFDPQIARKLQPETLRARFGINRVLNAIHCTNCQQDNLKQLQIVFGYLQQQTKQCQDTPLLQQTILANQ